MFHVNEAEGRCRMVRAGCRSAWGAKAPFISGRLLHVARRPMLGQFAIRPFFTILGLCVGSLFCLFGFCNWHRQASQFASARHTHSPGERCLVPRAIFSQVKALCTIWPASIAFGLAILASKAIVGCSRRRSSSTTFTRRSR